ncbi:probable G-protein coupled receptor 139 [Rhincodon typus]|uniref:probable G-protein coupled receptor 139 n=1 Tax=Rhincodon typus TaxID=259920 RepID=UPI00202FAE58|nr:probable G-protein coupled receptor 139 [Rhincodon typus]
MALKESHLFQSHLQVPNKLLTVSTQTQYNFGRFQKSAAKTRAAFCCKIQASTLSVTANIVTIFILSRGKCGLSKCITRYLVAMAVADLMILILEVILYEIKDAYFPYTFLNYTPICSLNMALLFISIDCSVWITVAFTFDRFIAICCQRLRAKYCTEKTAAVVIIVVFSLSCLQNVPIYFIYEPRELIDNVPWSCYVKSSFYTSPLWIAFLWLESLLIPFLPFIFILMLNCLTTRYILMANRVRSVLRGNHSAGSNNDPEMNNRRKSIILLLAISGNFIMLWMVIFIYFLIVQFADVQFFETSYNDSFTIMEQTGYMLSCLSSCTNTFIYAVSQRKFREELKNMTKHCLTPITRVIK